MCDLLAVDEAYPEPVVDDATRLRVHQAWRHGQVVIGSVADGYGVPDGAGGARHRLRPRTSSWTPSAGSHGPSAHAPSATPRCCA